MLKIADYQPEIIKKCLDGVVSLLQEGKITVRKGRIFHVNDIDKAHDYLENRQSIGKIAVTWEK